MATVVSNMQVVNQLGQDVTLSGFLASSNPQKLPSEEKTYVIKAGTTATLDPLVALKTTITATIGTVAYAIERSSLSPSGTPLDFQYVVKLDGNVMTFLPQAIKVVKDPADLHLDYGLSMGDVGSAANLSAPSTTEPSLAQMWTGRSRHHQGDSASSSTFIGIAATVALWMIVLLMLIGVILIGVRGKA